MKRLFSLVLTLTMLFSIVSVPQVSAAKADYMEIYGLNLSVAGDSTLLKLSGNWLLIDTGDKDSSTELITHLKNYGVKKLDIYISHLHPDHYGGVAEIGDCTNISVGTIYLPHSSIGSEYEHQEYFLEKLYEDSGASNVAFLKKGSKFSYHGCTAEVLGPVGNYTVSQFESSDASDDAEILRSYLNNYSLTTKFTCGDIDFLTTGDIEAVEENNLVKYYKKGELNSEVLKLAHHGVTTSSTKGFLDAVSPDYSYAPSRGYQIYSTRKNASEYGIVYMVGDEKATFGFKTDGSYMKSYKGNTELTGWVSLAGGFGNDGKYNKFYVKDGKTLKGIQTVNGKKYHFGNGGCMIIGDYEDGVYKPWRRMDGGMRAFEESGEMYVGFREINGNTFYFDASSGLRLLGDEAWKLTEIGGKYYALNENGAVRRGGWLSYTNKGVKEYRYFGADGAMKTGWFKLGDKKYYFNPKTGYREVGLKKIGKKTYYFIEKKRAAYMYTSGWKKFGKKYRYFGSDGVMYTGWKKIKGKYYYFSKSTGYSYTKTGLKTIGGKKYYMVKSGKGSYRYNTKGWKKFGKKYRYFQKNGVVTTGWKKIGKAKYYFDKNGYRVTGTKKIKGKTYKFAKNGKLKK